MLVRARRVQEESLAPDTTWAPVNRDQLRWPSNLCERAATNSFEGSRTTNACRFEIKEPFFRLERTRLQKMSVCSRGSITLHGTTTITAHFQPHFDHLLFITTSTPPRHHLVFSPYNHFMCLVYCTRRESSETMPLRDGGKVCCLVVWRMRFRITKQLQFA